MAQALGRLDALRARADKAHELADHVTQTRALRGTICELTAVVGEAVARLSDGLPAVLAETLDPVKVAEMAERDPEKPFRLLRGLGKTVQELTAMSESVIKLERLLMGETTEHKGHTVQIEGPAEAVAIIERAARAAARAGGGATAIPGRPGPTKVLPPS